MSHRKPNDWIQTVKIWAADMLHQSSTVYLPLTINVSAHCLIRLSSSVHQLQVHSSGDYY